MSPDNNQLDKCRKYSGVLAWMNDIEVHEGAYISAILCLVAGMFLVHQPLFEVTVPYFGSVLITVNVPGLESASIVVVMTNLAAIFMLSFPMMKFFEWKYRWFLPVLAAFAAEASAVILVILKKKEIAEDALVNVLMEMFSIEVSVTPYTWLFLLVSALGMGAALKMVLDIKKNNLIYMYE